MNSDHEKLAQGAKSLSINEFVKWAVLLSYKALYGFICVGIFFVFCILGQDMLRREAAVIMLLFYLLGMLFSHEYNAQQIGQERISELLVSQAVSAFLSYTGMFIVFNFIRFLQANIWMWSLSFLSTLIFSIVWTVVGNKLYFAFYPAMNTVVVNGSPDVVDIFDYIRVYPKKFNIIDRINLPDILQDLDVLLKYDAVILNDVSTGQRSVILKHCIRHDVKAFIRPKIGDLILSNSKRTKILDFPMITVQNNESSIGYRVTKRLLDIILSTVGLLLASPIMLLIALWIKIDDHGPVIYKQIRLTKGFCEFKLYKFRSMCVDAEKDGVARLACENDDRITRVGRFIRATRFDELPQLVNILKGDMSIVGPRPERPTIADQYAETFPEFHLRLLSKAGLTGYAQVYGKYNTRPYDKLQLDLLYIVNQSFLTDLKLMFFTIKVIFSKHSTEGIEEGKVTADANEKV